MVKEFIAGWIAGGTGVIIGHPLDTIKARIQTSNSYAGIADAVTKIVRKESAFGLYKGMLAPFVSVGFMNSLLFAGYSGALRLMHPDDLDIENRKDIPMREVVVASIAGTLLQLIPAIPVELVKTRLQVQRENTTHFMRRFGGGGDVELNGGKVGKLPSGPLDNRSTGQVGKLPTGAHSQRVVYTGAVDLIRQVMQREGVRGLYKGGSVIFCRDNIGFLFYLPTYEALNRTLHRRGYGETTCQIVAGGTAGALGWVVITPIEVVKNRMQITSSLSARAAAAGVFAEHGVRGFCRGGLLLCLRGFPVNAAVFVVYENTIRAMNRQMSLSSSLRLLVAFFGTLCAVHALDNGLARTPPMGWMSWTAFYCEMDCIRHPHACINEQLYMDMADRLAADGYLAAGYRNVHVDDCWMGRQRDASGRLVSDPIRFPSGMKSLARYMHDRGLNFGIYEDYGTKTCAGFPGSFGFLQLDANTFAEWDVDYLKLDGCNINLDLMPHGYPEMSRALNATGRPIVYSCSWPAYLINQPQKVDYNVIGHYCNLWRNFDDINSSWKSIMSIINYYDHNQDRHIPTQKPGAWHDPDMLVIGNPGISVDQARAQMTIWSIWSAPLIMSNDLRNIAPVFRDILLNKRVIAVDQDPLGRMGRLVANTTDVGVYVKSMTPFDAATSDFSFAVGVLNRNLVNRNSVEFVLNRLGLSSPGGYRVDDLWSGQLVGVFRPNDNFQTIVNPTSANLYKFTPVALANMRNIAFAKF